MRIPFALALASTLWATPAWSKITLTTSPASGATIAGEAKFVALVESDALVTSVEFFVGDDLRSTDDSTPYEFVMDTLDEADGQLKVTVTAYNEKGESAKAVLNLTVDNEVAKGAPYLAQKAADFASVSDWKNAVRFGRAALKADPGDSSARLVLAQAYLGAGQFDRAQQHAEDAIKADPDNRRARDLLSAIHLKRAFSTLDRGDRAKTAETIRTAFGMAAKSRRESLELAADSFGTVTDDNRVAYVDRLLAAGRYSLAIQELRPRFREKPDDNRVADRLMFAQIRAGRLQDAAQTMKDVQRFGSFDGEGQALRAVLLLFAGEDAPAAEAEKEALLDSPNSMVVATCRTWMALRRNDMQAARTLATGLAANQGQDPVVNAALSALYWRLGDYESSQQAFETAVLAEPGSVDLYVEKANQVLQFSFRTDIATEDAEFQRKLADAYFAAALEAKPDSFQALTGKAVTLALLKDGAGALRMAEAATKAGPAYAAAHYVRAALLFDLGQNTAAKEALKSAEEADPKGLGGRPIPKVPDAWRYFAGAGRLPYVAAPRG